MASMLFAYSLTAHVRRKKDQRLRMDQLHGDGAGGDVLDVFDATVVTKAEWPPAPDDGPDTRERIVTVDDVRTDPNDDRVRYGRVKTTRQSIRYDLMQSTGGTIAVTEQDREGRPLFYWLSAPSGSTTALLLTERRARFGIVTSFWQQGLVQRLRTAYEDETTFDFAYYAPLKVWEEYRQHGSGIDGLVFRKVLTEEDETKELDHPNRRRKIGTVRTRVERHRSPAREIVADILERGARTEAIELLIPEDMDLGDLAEPDAVIMQLDIDGKHRTVTLGRDHAPHLGYPVADVGLDVDGYPKLEEMAAFAADLALQIS